MPIIFITGSADIPTTSHEGGSRRIPAQAIPSGAIARCGAGALAKSERTLAAQESSRGMRAVNLELVRYQCRMDSGRRLALNGQVRVLRGRRIMVGQRPGIDSREQGIRAEPIPSPLRDGSDPSDPRHTEWLIDEASEESFPASDSSSAAMPHPSPGQRPQPKMKT